ncbi:MAG: hypothetical protein K2O04_03620, partial [Clostridiales bacterium]|nr:hypothetical protein [Clostridiales bacterium]
GNPCDGYNDNAKWDADFLSAYGGYATCAAEKYMRAYFYLLSVAYNRNGVCEVFGMPFTAAGLAVTLKTAAKDAAEKGLYDKFLLVRQLLIHKVFGEYNSEYERMVAAATTAESALFDAYYGMPDSSRLLYFDGKYLSAESIARKIGERGSVGNVLTDTDAMSFMSAVGRRAKVDVPRIKAEIENGIKNVLEGLK